MPTLNDLKALEAVLSRMTPEQRKEIARNPIVAQQAKKAWLPLPGPQTEAYNSKADVLLYGGAAGGGKLIDINEVIPTPTGWVRMGDINVGDYVFSEHGIPTRVVGVSAVEIAKTYRLTFDDGFEIQCCSDHLWHTYDAKDLAGLTRKSPEWRAKRRAARPSRTGGNKSAAFRAAISKRNSELSVGGPPPAGSVKTTQQIVDSLTTSSGRRNHAVQVASYLKLPDIDLPIDPYVLGAWLGDGTSLSGGFTGIDEEIWLRIQSCGYVVNHRKISQSHYILGLVPKLKSLGLIYNKHVPSIYFRSSKAQRLALLQGLMDTDGHAALDGGCEFDNTNRRLIDAVYELVSSLGIKASISEGTATLNGRVIGPRWRVKFVTDEPVFFLKRKMDRMRGFVRRTAKFRYITSAVEIDPIPMRCIAVDNPSHLYLVGRAMVPTHNSILLLGLAACEHRRSLIVRREAGELDGLVAESRQILSNRGSYNGTEKEWTFDKDKSIKFGGMKEADDWRKYAGRARDFMGFDEAAEFLEEQVSSILSWLRSTDAKQRCRVVLASNPPRSAEGEWIIRWFAPWLDPNSEVKALPGEVKWCVNANDKLIWLNSKDKVTINGKEYTPESRTFIPAKLKDNIYFEDGKYRAQLENRPGPLRDQLLDGDFTAGKKDADWQVIPTQWVIAAQGRWKPDGWKNLTMTAMGLDPAGGGRDSAELAYRHGSWYAPLVSAQGAETADGSATAGTVLRYRRDGCPIVVDVGGGYGGAVITKFKDNDIDFYKFDGGSGSNATALGSGLKFKNKRAEAWWRFREALDPDQEGGATIALPPDMELRADLSAPRWKTTNSSEILLEDKAEIRKRLGRSPGKGDAVVMALVFGNKAAIARMNGVKTRFPIVNLGYSALKKRFR